LRVGLHARLLAAGVGGRVAGGELRGLERAEACVALVGLVDLRGDVVGALQQLVDVAVVVGVGQELGDLVALLGEGGRCALDGPGRGPADDADGAESGPGVTRERASVHRCVLPGPWTAHSRLVVWVAAVRLSRPVDRARLLHWAFTSGQCGPDVGRVDRSRGGAWVGAAIRAVGRASTCVVVRRGSGWAASGTGGTAGCGGSSG